MVEYAERRMFLWPPFSLLYHSFIFSWYMLWYLAKFLASCCSCKNLIPTPPEMESGLKPKKRKDAEDEETQKHLLRLQEFERRCCIQLMKKKEGVDTQ